MIWPVAALAVFLLGFVVVYGSVLQARLEPRLRGAADDSGGVVLNNRGYNYGPAPGPQLDALLGDAAANPSDDAR